MVMLGLGRMNRRLPQAVIATFRDDDHATQATELRRFSIRDWARNMRWLDTSGLALYFLDRVSTLGLQECVPGEVLQQLQQRHTDNRRRTESLFEEFVVMNRRLQEAGVQYVNLKGFSLIPDYCPDLSLRYQLDLDLLMCAEAAPQCCEVLESLGYAANKPDDHVVEFTAGMERVPSIRDLYKPKPRRCIEVHFTISLPETAETLLQRCRPHSQNGVTFPVLSEADVFLAQAFHLFKHVQGEWLRVSWLLEFKTFVATRRDDAAFWRQVRASALNIPRCVVALGVATWLCTEAFGKFAPSDLTDWTVDVLPPAIRLWLERYGQTVLLCDFPGTKLYLLLKSELSDDRESGSKLTRSRLLPLHRPPRVARATGASMGSRLRASIDQLRFGLFRLKFHVIEGSRYVVEAQRWKRLVTSSPR